MMRKQLLIVLVILAIAVTISNSCWAPRTDCVKLFDFCDRDEDCCDFNTRCEGADPDIPDHLKIKGAICNYK